MKLGLMPRTICRFLHDYLSQSLRLPGEKQLGDCEPVRQPHQMPGRQSFIASYIPVVFLCFFAILPSRLMSQQETGPIRIQTTLVNVPVMVTDSGGGAILGLRAEDFSLYDDGVRQPLAFFAAAAEPIRIALVMDTSKSTATVLDRIRKAAAGFLDQLRPQDQAMVVSFDSEVHVLCRFDSEVGELKRAIRGAEVGAYVGTKMRDAVVLAADRYLRASQGRKAMILLTDGQDYGSKASADDMIRAALNAGIVIYPVYYAVDRRELIKKLFGVTLSKNAVGAAEWEKDEREAAALLRRTAEESAGKFFRSGTTDLKQTFVKVAEELRHQYLLAFYPDPGRIDGTPHALRVDMSRPDLVVRARRSYHAAAGVSK